MRSIHKRGKKSSLRHTDLNQHSSFSTNNNKPVCSTDIFLAEINFLFYFTNCTLMQLWLIGTLKKNLKKSQNKGKVQTNAPLQWLDKQLNAKIISLYPYMVSIFCDLDQWMWCEWILSVLRSVTEGWCDIMNNVLCIWLWQRWSS